MPEQLIEAADSIADGHHQVPATPAQRDGFKLQVGESQSPQLSAVSSNLSSLLSTIGTTPEGLFHGTETRPLEQVGTTGTGSPIRRSKRGRKAIQRYDRHDSDDSTSSGVKRRKINLSSTKGPSGSSTAVASPETTHLERIPRPPLTSDLPDLQNSRLPAASMEFDQPGQNSSSDSCERQLAIAESNIRAEPLAPQLGAEAPPGYSRVKDNELLEVHIAHAFLQKAQNCVLNPQDKQDQTERYLRRLPTSTALGDGLSHEGPECAELYKGFDRRNPIYHHVDGVTKTASSNAGQPGSNRDSDAPSPSMRGGKGSNLGKGGKGHGKSGKANKGRLGGAGGGRDRDRDRDSPEPPNRTPMTQEDKRLLAHIRTRQADLRRFYATVMAQQREALEMTASRDLTRLLRKQRAHTKNREYEEVVEQLRQKEQNTKNIINKEYDMQVALAEEWRKAQEEVINNQWHKRTLSSKEEHAKGAQGDLIIFHKAHRAAGDETKTDNGSDIECYFPRYHELPEPDTEPRGYNSSRINDEKSFKEHLANYDEQAQRDIIEDDIVGPVVQSIAVQNAQRQAEEERKVRFESLVSVAKDELKEKPGYPNPRPVYPSENPQFALSRLADCAEYISRAHPTQSCVFMPIASRDVPGFSLHHLERVPSQSLPDAVSSTPASQPQSSTPRKSITRRNKSFSVPTKRLSRDEEAQSQSSSNASTPLPAIAPAPSRMPPPPVVAQHHHHQHVLPQQIPLASTSSLRPPPPPPPPPSLSAPSSRPPGLTPLITSRPYFQHNSPPAIPANSQTPTMPIQGPPQPPPPPPPEPFRPGSILAQYGPPLPQLGRYPSPGSYQPRAAFHPPVPQAPRLERPPPQSPVESTTPVDQPPPRFSVSTSTQGLPKPRVGGPRRAPGEITFTNVQTPDSERFRSPSQPPPNQPGQAVLRPGGAPNTPNGLGTGKIANTFVNAAPDANSRSQQAADAARVNAMVNAGQGAGPKGGRRVLLPKGQRY